ncbi:xanthine dehydrogenase family protein subunit M [Streptomyces sp. DH37]|uniref:FAD binding domain-containing protein n=1 Tax=Streptomyces sp. DH37 TaxID=3040122 RepID=UPI0024424774|nr:xanthine dehydrogenase family protein subunit M [Streptomyces sp. DH37]MDG9701997.1 xanthine dehydrogenase family protein subunit M [Streptomyces sp. DH37]
MRPFSYTVPATLADAVEALAAGGPGTRALAGGTSLYDLMKLGVETPTALVDIRGLAELAGFDTTGPGELVFGAGARMADVAGDPVLLRDYPVLAESLTKAASPQLRNMATVGGNLLQRTRCGYFRAGPPFPCNRRRPGSGCAARGGPDRDQAVLGTSESCSAAYPGDWAVALTALDARLDLLGPRGPRTMALSELHREPGDTPEHEHDLEPGELVVRIRVPATATGRASTYHKVRDRESYAFALASAAVAVGLDDRRRVVDCRIALGGLATRPWRAREAERTLLGRPLTEDGARRAGEAALAGARPGLRNAFKTELGVRTVVAALRVAGLRAAS